MDIDKIENKALKVGVFISIIMALAGWLTYYISKSEAMLLDGNFSLISAIAITLAMIISKRKHEKTKTFPFGSYAYESLFVFIKGILIVGVILVAAVQNSVKIIDFLNGVYIEPVKLTSILYYVVFMTILCFGLFFYFRAKNKSIDYRSTILKVETQSSLLDAFLSLGIGIVFIGISLLPPNSSVDFLKSIGDAIIVLVVSLLFIKIPFKIIRESFIELGGGVLQDKSSKQIIEKAIDESLSPDFIKQSSYISKLGSSYFIAATITSKTGLINLDNVEALRKNVLGMLTPKFSNVKFEVIVRGQDTLL